MNTETVVDLVRFAISEFYKKDKSLVDRDLCERCMVHRLAVYLESIFKGFYVDCEFNKSFYEDKVNRKILSNLNGNYVDIIIHKRSNNFGENLLCFEVKKANNFKDRDKDRENLRILTNIDRFAYLLGFYIILGKTFEKTKLEVYSQSQLIQQVSMI